MEYTGYIPAVSINNHGNLTSTLNVTTDGNGDATFTVRSSDLISKPDIIIKENMIEKGRIACDFGSMISIRRFPDPNDPNDLNWKYNDKGWICNTTQLTNPGSYTPLKVYLKFMKNSSLGNIDGNWSYVNNHNINIFIESIKTYDGNVIINPQSIKDYIFIKDQNNGNHITSFTTGTANDGSAQIDIHSGPLIGDVDEIIYNAIDMTQRNK